jgi:hypothetical protein
MIEDPIIVYALLLAVVAGLLTWYVDSHSEGNQRKR